MLLFRTVICFQLSQLVVQYLVLKYIMRNRRKEYKKTLSFKSLRKNTVSTQPVCWMDFAGLELVASATGYQTTKGFP